MKLFKRFYPQNHIESAYDIAYDELFRQGFRGIIFDIDNTLVEHGAPANEAAVKLFAALKQIGYQTLVLSNNKEPRVKSFAEAVGTKYIHRAGKPKILNYRKAMEVIGTVPETTIFVGDQLFTDIWGANIAGINSYLVDRIGKKEEIQIVIKRYLEKPVLYYYKKSKRKIL
ncbi:MAG: YqeG family HAD IIIA-type phosphatase [Lachnospiraceae bacterium]|nr:YqeG family HAD IIIA-type phosphatase [Lachnospiraceae bacterium]